MAGKSPADRHGGDLDCRFRRVVFQTLVPPCGERSKCASAAGGRIRKRAHQTRKATTLGTCPGACGQRVCARFRLEIRDPFETGNAPGPGRIRGGR